MDQVVLTPTQKAAAILVAIGKSRASRLIGMFKKEELRMLVDAERSLRSIPQPDLESLVECFEAEFAEGAGLLDSGETMETILNEGLTEEEMEKFKSPEATATDEEPDSSDIWEALENTEPEALAKYLSKQNAQTIALICSQLSTQKTGQILPHIDPETRKSVFARILSLKEVPQLTMRLLERNLAAEFEDVEQYITEITQSAGEMKAAAVKARLFRFDDIVSLDQSARTSIFDNLAADLIVLALGDTAADVREAVMSSVGQRARRMIEAELTGTPAQPPAKVKQAQKEIIELIMTQVSEGQIQLPAQQEAA
jgi:flagellar motor switch protein FliG